MPNATGTQAASWVERAGGIAQQNRSGAARSSAWEAVRPHCHHPVTRAQPGDLVADGKDGAGALVAHDVGGGGDFVARPVQRVAAFDADRLDPHEHPVGGHGGIGDVLVAEDLGAARVVVDRGLHVCSCPVG